MLTYQEINPENSVDLMDNDMTNSLFADGEHIFNNSEYIFSVGEYKNVLGE